MSKRKKRLPAMRQNPVGVRFTQLELVLIEHGWTKQGHKGSHRIWSHPAAERPITLQDCQGEAKPYQVRQVIDAIDKVRASESED